MCVCVCVSVSVRVRVRVCVCVHPDYDAKRPVHISDEERPTDDT